MKNQLEIIHPAEHPDAYNEGFPERCCIFCRYGIDSDDSGGPIIDCTKRGVEVKLWATCKHWEEVF